jgi:hypothetical protein
VRRSLRRPRRQSSRFKGPKLRIGRPRQPGRHICRSRVACDG